MKGITQPLPKMLRIVRADLYALPNHGVTISWLGDNEYCQR